MDYPAIFETVCWAFYPESRREYETVDDWIKGTVKGFVPKAERPTLKAYLDEILSGNYSDDELHRIYMSTGPSWAFSKNGGTRWFLSKIRAELG